VINSCVYRLTNILLYWYNTTGWLQTKNAILAYVWLSTVTSLRLKVLCDTVRYQFLWTIFTLGPTSSRHHSLVFLFREKQKTELCIIYDHKTVYHNRFLVNKTNRCTEFQFYWYYYSPCFGQSSCPSSEVLSRTSALVHFMQLWWPFATRNRMELYG
jgi:hypothetical protein